MNEHELKFVMSFILKEKRGRYLELLSKPKRRSKILGRLNHTLDIDYSFATPLHAIAEFALPDLVISLGAGPTCHVIADACPFDGEEMAIGDAARVATLNQFGVLLSFIPGELVYYKPESPGPGFLLQRKKTHTDRRR